MSERERWQRLAIDRAIVAALAEHEVEEARNIGDAERLTIADRYHNQAQRLLATANRKLMELV
jgi:hypothetical protein